jgi:hypothetical protein
MSRTEPTTITVENNRADDLTMLLTMSYPTLELTTEAGDFNTKIIYTCDADDADEVESLIDWF